MPQLGWPRLSWRVRATDGAEDRYWLFKRPGGWSVLVVLDDASHQVLRFGTLLDLESYVDATHEAGAWAALAAAADFLVSEHYEHF